jgi:CheY-like chemotaxis protein
MMRATKRVLIVGDKKLYRASLAAALERGGHDVVLGENGAEALTQLAGADVVLFDLDMQSLDVMRLLEGLTREAPARRNAWQAWQTVMAVADFCDPGAAARLYALGVERVLIRGQVTPTDLCALVDALPARPMAA